MQVQWAGVCWDVCRGDVKGKCTGVWCVQRAVGVQAVCTDVWCVNILDRMNDTQL